LNQPTIPTRAKLAETPELRDRLIAYVAERDRVPLDRAKTLFASLSFAELTRLELEADSRRQPPFTAEYDPFAR
jgi:hypothetical protein